MRRIFLTFGDGRTGWIRAGKRIQAEAQKSELFTNCHNFTFNSISEIDPHAASIINLLRNAGQFRGFGYWVWKPAILNWAHRAYPDALLTYIDSGSHILTENCQPNFEEYLLRAEQAGGLAWNLPSHNEYSWTKKELIDHLAPETSILEMSQVQSGYISLPPSAQRNELITSWRDLSLTRNGYFFTDEHGDQQCKEFVEHRHDQSALSLLWKMASLPSDEDCTFPYPDNVSPVISARNNTALKYGRSKSEMQAARYVDLAFDAIFSRK